LQQKKIINIEKGTVEELKKTKARDIYRDNNNLSLLLLNKPAEI